MARRRRIPTVEPEPTPASHAEPLDDWVDPRHLLTIEFPATFRHADDGARLAWLREQHPDVVRDEAEVHAMREHLDRERRYRRACMEARRQGLAPPDPAEFFPGFNT